MHEYGIANQCTINPQKSVCKNLKDFWKKSLGLYFFRKSQTLVVKAHQAIKLGKCTEASRLTSQAKNLEGRHNEILELERLYGQCIGQFELTREQYELNMKWTNIF